MDEFYLAVRLECFYQEAGFWEKWNFHKAMKPRGRMTRPEFVQTIRLGARLGFL